MKKKNNMKSALNAAKNHLISDNKDSLKEIKEHNKLVKKINKSKSK